MDSINSHLFAKIANFEIGHSDDTLTFLDRLSRENDWSNVFAQRCLEEYKKFIYLASFSDQAITPSDQVDQVWHLHLTYTRSYWNDLCGDVLEKPLHHGPTRGGKKEGHKYRTQYQYTLDLYARVFNKKPPNDIWPNCDQRFYQVDKFVRLNTANYVLINKPSKTAIKTTLGIISLPLLLTACSSSDTKITQAVILLVCLFAVSVYLYKSSKKPSGSNGKGNTGGGCGAGGQNNNAHNSDAGDSGCGGCGG